MNKNWKRVGFILLAVGAILIIIGLLSGAWKSDIGNNNFALGWNSGMFDVPTESLSYDFENVTGIEGDLALGTFEFITGDSFTIEANGVPAGMCNIRESGGTVYIETKKSKALRLGNLSHDMKVTVTVPSDTVLNSLDLECGMADVVLDGLRATDVSIDIGMAAFKGKNADFRDVDITCGMGDVDLSLMQKRDYYSVETEGGMSDIEIEGGAYELPNAKGEISVDCGMGSVSVSFLK